jgi:hypothetical protein
MKEKISMKRVTENSCEERERAREKGLERFIVHMKKLHTMYTETDRKLSRPS